MTWRHHHVLTIEICTIGLGYLSHRSYDWFASDVRVYVLLFRQPQGYGTQYIQGEQRRGLGTGAAVGLGVGALAAGGLAGYALGGGFSSDSPPAEAHVSSFDGDSFGGDDWMD
ncbi:unnamed protein product [Euphydryas editha]|uniref:Uncharacterized protein n=1 Tax=Euphydryas editha TaxID=104508 RepID=A0AAU9UPS3_EUPED|nr:unnamed protein product [Euphydryas editha]